MSDYTILSRAAEIAENEGISQAEAEGRLVEHHQYKIQQVIDEYEARRGSLVAKRDRIVALLAEAEADLESIDRQIVDATDHDRLVLGLYMREAPQYQDTRTGKTHRFAWGSLSSRKMTKAPQAHKAHGADAALIERYPQFARDVKQLAWGDLKKTFVVTDDGVVTDANGEIVPRELVIGAPREEREEYSLKIGGLKLSLLTSEVLDDGDGDSEDGADSDDFDPFGD